METEMTNKEKAKGLYEIMVVQDRTRAERLAAWDEMQALAKGAKTTFAKLTGSALDFKLLRQEIEALPDDPGEMTSEGEAIEAQGKSDVHKELTELISNPTITIEPKHDPLDEPLKAKDDPVVQLQAEGAELTPEAAKAHVDASKRGLISAEVRRLLRDTDLTYSEIEEAVRAKHPEARTTTRSIASTAADMRKAGEKVGQRRVPAKAAS